MIVDWVAEVSMTPFQHMNDIYNVKNIFVSDIVSNSYLLPPAYLVRREGNVFDTRLSFHQSVCPQGGVPISHNALQHFPECHGADTRGVPCQVQLGGKMPGGYPARRYPPGGIPCLKSRGYPAGGTLLGGSQLGYAPSQGCNFSGGVPCQGVALLGGTLLEGYPAWGEGVPCWGYPAGGFPGRVSPQPGQNRGGTLLGGGPQLGQQKEYSLHDGQYASCVHAGGLSCCIWNYMNNK